MNLKYLIIKFKKNNFFKKIKYKIKDKIINHLENYFNIINIISFKKIIVFNLNNHVEKIKFIIFINNFKIF